MKKILLISTLCLFALNVFGQKKAQQDNTPYTFYGVDFSKVNVIGATEAKDNFISAFEGIELLLTTEQKKYDLGKLAKIKITDTDTELAKSRIALLNNIEFMDGQTNEIDAAEFAKIYSVDGKDGVIIVAKELNKGRNQGSFVYIFFNSNGEVTRSYEKTGKAGGFGLRNFWAASLLNSMK